jgi:hypothetical protein
VEVRNAEGDQTDPLLHVLDRTWLWKGLFHRPPDAWEAVPSVGAEPSKLERRATRRRTT